MPAFVQVAFMTDVPYVNIQFVACMVLKDAGAQGVDDQSEAWFAFIEVAFTKQVSTGNIQRFLFHCPGKSWPSISASGFFRTCWFTESPSILVL